MEEACVLLGMLDPGYPHAFEAGVGLVLFKMSWRERRGVESATLSATASRARSTG
jgi:hypothetical protein